MAAVCTGNISEPSTQLHYVYDEFGVVSDWGPPNVDNYLASVPFYGVLQVEAWKTWQVKVWWQRSGHPWFLSHIFYVLHFEDMHRHCAMYFDRGQGRTERISFEVECLLWSIQGGWEFQDYM